MDYYPIGMRTELNSSLSPTLENQFDALFVMRKINMEKIAKQKTKKNENVLPRRLRIQVAHYQRLTPI